MCDRRSFHRPGGVFGVVVLMCLSVLCYGLCQQSSARTNSRSPQPSAIPSDKQETRAANSQDKKVQARKAAESEAPAQGPAALLAGSAEQREQFFRSAVEDILIGADRVNSPEHCILVQVEAATLLWDIDRDRANSVLKGALEKFRTLLEKKEDAKARDASTGEKERLRASIFRRLARLNPNLISELLLQKADSPRSDLSIVTDWTEEARAILTVAHEEIDRNPEFAAKLAQKSLSFGTVGLPNFLIALARRDRQLAEQQAMILLSRLRDSTVHPLFLLGFAQFVFLDDKGSPQLRDRYFQSLAIRIRREVRTDIDAGDVEDLMNAVRSASQTAKGYPQWQAEFAQITSDLESLLATRSLPVPGAAPAVTVRMPKVAAEGDTRDIAEAADKVQNINDPKARDREYKRLAVSAAQKADVKLAERLVSKIEDEDARRKASIDAYSPLVRKALGESDWAAARMYALRVADPLGRSLMIDWVAQKMKGARQTRESVKDCYDAALAELRHDSPTREVALSFMALARSTLATDPESSVDALRWAVYVLNKVDDRLLSRGPDLTGEIGTWVRRQSTPLSPEETLDVTEIIGPTFDQMSKRDFNEALALASGLSERGLSLLAKLGVFGTVAEEVRNSKKLIKSGKQTPPKD